MAKKYYDENGNEVKVKQKRGGCLKWLLYGFIVIVVLGACGALLGDGEDNKDTVNEPKTEEDSKDDETKEEEKDKQEKENSETKKKEEQEKKAKEQEEKENDGEIKISENEDGVMIFDQYGEVSLSQNTFVAKFSRDMAEELKKHKDETKNGAIFRLASPLVDNYGNESKKYVMAVYYTQDTIDKINVDNWPLNVSDGLYKTADGVIVHPALRDNKHAETKVYEGDQPEEYTYSVDSEYEE